MIVLFDMDDVVADTSEYLLRVLRKEHPDNPAFKTPRKQFDIKDAYLPEDLKLVESVLYSPDFQLTIPPVPGSLEAITEISRIGHNVKFCSTPHRYFETCVLQKYQWIEKHLGRQYVRKITLTYDKTCEYGDYLIDDKPEITGELETPFWEHILFTQEYNRHINPKRRLDRWEDWKVVLPELLK